MIWDDRYSQVSQGGGFSGLRLSVGGVEGRLLKRHTDCGLLHTIRTMPTLTLQSKNVAPKLLLVFRVKAKRPPKGFEWSTAYRLQF